MYVHLINLAFEFTGLRVIELPISNLCFLFQYKPSIRWGVVANIDVLLPFLTDIGFTYQGLSANLLTM